MRRSAAALLARTPAPPPTPTPEGLEGVRAAAAAAMQAVDAKLAAVRFTVSGGRAAAPVVPLPGSAQCRPCRACGAPAPSPSFSGVCWAASQPPRSRACGSAGGRGGARPARLLWPHPLAVAPLQVCRRPPLRRTRRLRPAGWSPAITNAATATTNRRRRRWLWAGSRDRGGSCRPPSARPGRARHSSAWRPAEWPRRLRGIGPRLAAAGLAGCRRCGPGRC